MKKIAAKEAEIIERLVGTWRLVKWSATKPGGQEEYPLGKDAVGQIVYTKDGSMSAQLVRADCQRFASADWSKASDKEAARAWREYVGYFGRYSIDLSRNAVIHHIEGGWFPNLKGTDQVREFRFEGSRLILRADTAWEKVEVIWERVARLS